MTAYDLFTAAWGIASRHPMTPTRETLGKLNAFTAFELSSGCGIRGAPLWGITIARLDEKGAAHRCDKASRCFTDSSGDEAIAYVRELKKKLKGLSAVETQLVLEVLP